MKNDFSIDKNTVHLWRVKLTDLFLQENQFLVLLSQDELQRANRFRFAKHRQRFVVARGVLRSILSLYTNISPQEIMFLYGPRGKPFLENNIFNLQFNVSHSEDVAVYALTVNNEIGVDIQKIEDKYNDAVAKRFFSQQEYTQLSQLSEDKRAAAFCQLWAGKEAVIKAMGEGLYVPLGEFFIALEKKSQWIALQHEQFAGKYYLQNFIAQSEYCSAFAVNDDVKKIFYWEWLNTGKQSWDYFDKKS